MFFSGRGYVLGGFCPGRVQSHHWRRGVSDLGGLTEGGLVRTPSVSCYAFSVLTWENCLYLSLVVSSKVDGRNGADVPWRAVVWYLFKITVWCWWQQFWGITTASVSAAVCWSSRTYRYSICYAVFTHINVKVTVVCEIILLLVYTNRDLSTCTIFTISLQLMNINNKFYIRLYVLWGFFIKSSIA